MSNKIKSKLQIKERRVFSVEIKKQLVKSLTSGRQTIKEVMIEHQVSAQSVYSWIYKYSVGYAPKPILVVQMKSEATKNQELQQRLGELERIVGQKQLEIDYLNKLLEIGSKELDFDLKKNFSSKLSNGSEAADGSIPT